MCIRDRCGVGFLYRSLGDKIHFDDMREVELLLGLTSSGMDLLFELQDQDIEIARQEGFFESYDDNKYYGGEDE